VVLATSLGGGIHFLNGICETVKGSCHPSLLRERGT